MKRYSTNGARVKELREARHHGATQKEFAHEVGLNVRTLRKIENENTAQTIVVLERIAKALNAEWRDIVFSPDKPKAVPDQSSAVAPVIPPSGPILIPRFDSYPASVVKDEATLYELATKNDVVVSHILTKLTAETEALAGELLDAVSDIHGKKSSAAPRIDGREELRLRRRLRELLVLLKGNDVWVYALDHMKDLPESDEVRKAGDPIDFECQTIIAFGPPGEYGEETLSVPVDNGRPSIVDPNRRFSWDN